MVQRGLVKKKKRTKKEKEGKKTAADLARKRGVRGRGKGTCPAAVRGNGEKTVRKSLDKIRKKNKLTGILLNNKRR